MSHNLDRALELIDSGLLEHPTQGRRVRNRAQPTAEQVLAAAEAFPEVAGALNRAMSGITEAFGGAVTSLASLIQALFPEPLPPVPYKRNARRYGR